MDVFKPAKPNGIGVLWMVSGGWVSNYNSINPGLAAIFEDDVQELIYFARDLLTDRFGRFFSSGERVSSTGRKRQTRSLTSTSS